MAAETHINDSGTWRKLSGVSVNDGGTWRTIQNVYVNDGGTWREVFTNLVIDISWLNGYSAFESDAPAAFGAAYGYINFVADGRVTYQGFPSGGFGGPAYDIGTWAVGSFAASSYEIVWTQSGSGHSPNTNGSSVLTGGYSFTASRSGDGYSTGT